MANPLSISLKVTGLDQAKADLAQFATIGKKSFDDLSREAKQFSQTALVTDQALKGVANRVRQLAAEVDPAFEANIKLRNSLSDVERALRANYITMDQARQMTGLLRAEHDKLAISTTKVTAEIRQLGTLGGRSFDAISAMAQRSAAALKPTAESTRDLALRIKELASQADPAAAANQRLMNSLEDVNRALKDNIINTRQAAQLTKFLEEQSISAARAEAELANKTIDAAKAKAQASIQAANAQRAASQIAVAAISLEIQEMDRLRSKSAGVITAEVIRRRSTGPADGTQAQVGLAENVASISRRADPQGAAAVELQRSVLAVNQALGSKIIEKPEAIRLIAFLNAEFEKLAATLDRAAAELGEFATIGSKSFSTLTAEATRLAAASDHTDQEMLGLVARVQSYAAAANPAAANNLKLRTSIEEINVVMARFPALASAGAEAIKHLEFEAGAYDRSIIKLKDDIYALGRTSAQSFADINREATKKATIAPTAPTTPQGERASNLAEFKRLAEAANPVTAANRKLAESIQLVRQAVKEEGADARVAEQVIAHLNTTHNKYLADLEKSSQAHANSAQSVSKMNNSLTQLSFQLNDIGTSLASGASPLMVLAQQGGQIFQVFQTAPGGVGGVLSAVGTQIAKLVNPVTLAAVAVTALAGSVLLLASRANETETRLRGYDVVLKAVGGSSQATAQDLELVAKGLQHTGSSAEEAQKQVLAFARTPLINPSAAGEISSLARDIATALDKDTVQLTEDLAKAIAGGTEEVIKLVSSLSGPNGLSIATSKAMKELARIGDPAGAARLGIKSLQDQFGGSFNSALSDGQKSINSIAAAWDNMLTKLEKTTIVTAAKDAVVGMLNAIAAAAASSPSAAVGALPPAPGSPYVPPDRGGAAPRGFKRDATGRLVRDYSVSIDGDTPSAGFEPPAPALTAGSALTRANTLNKDIAGLNIELQARLDAYFREFPDKYIRSAARVGAHPSEFNTSGIGLHNKDVLGMGVAADVGGLTGYDPNLARFGLRQNVTGDWRHVEPVEIPSIGSATGAARMAAAAQFNAVYGGGAITPGGTAAAPTFGSGVLPAPKPTAPLVAPGLNADQLRILEEGVRQQDLMTAATKAFGTANNEAQIWLSAYNSKIAQGADDEFNRTKAMQDANGALERHRIELGQQAETQRITNGLAVQTAQAFGVDEVEGYRKAAQAQAILAGRQGQLADSGLILAAQASEALVSGAKAIPGLKQQADATTRLAEAAKGGAGAEHEMGVQNQIVTATHDALTKAKATGNAQLIKEAQLLTEVTAAQIKKNDAAKEDLAIRQRMNQRTDQIAQVQLKTQMVGALPEEVEAANAKLVEQQTLLGQGKKLTDDISKASLANVDALNKVNIAHAEAQRQQERINDMYRQIGSTIESAIGNVIDGIFDPKKAVDWGKTVKDMARQLFSGIATNFFTKPLIGEVLGILGASSQVTSQYGSFSGIGGGATAASGGGTSLVGSLGSVGSIASGTGLLKELGITDAFKGVGDMFKGIFASTPAEGLTVSQSMGSFSFMPQAQAGLLGSTTFGQALGGVGLGFAGGSILNQLVGGKREGGMIGSGVGSLAGMLAGSFIPVIGPIIGGLLGGLAGGGLGGLFGNSKPSNASAGANIDLSQFKITAGFTGGNQQIDADMQKMGQNLQGFMDLLKTTGGTLSGNLLVQSGVNTGVTVDSSLEGYSGRFSLGKDTDVALKVIEQALVKSITGVSTTMKTVLSQVGTEDDIAKAISFANAYDKVSEAAAKSFEGLETTAQQMGPFETAMGEINALFAEMTTQATRFGLALEPVSAALAEATSRLQDDFLNAVQTASNVAHNQTYRNTIADTIDAYLASTREASGIGLTDKVTGDQLGQLFMDQISALFEGLSTAEVQDVITTSFAGMVSALVPDDVAANLDVLIDQLANTAISAGKTADALNDVTDAANRSKSAFTSISDLLNSLKVTPSATTSPEDALAASNAKFFELYNKASQGDLVALEGLTQAAQDYIDNIQSYYASSPTGQDTIAIITKGLQSLLDLNPQQTDQTKITNQLLTSIDTQVTGTAGSSMTLMGSTATLVADNKAAAAQAIQTNTDNMANFNKSLSDNAISNQTNNNLNTKTLTDANAESAAALIKQNTESKDALITANNEATTKILADAKIANDALIGSNTDTATAIVNQNAEAALALGEATTAAANKTVEANKTASDAIIAQNNTAATAALAANSLAKDAMITASNKALADQTAAASVDAQKMISDNATAATAAQTAATALKSETLASNTAQTTSVVAANEAAKTATVAATNASATAITAQTLASQTATVAANNTASASMVAASNTAKDATVLATSTMSAAVVADSKLQTTTAIAANNAATASMVVGADKNTTILANVFTSLTNSLIGTVSTGATNSINTNVAYFNYLYTTIWDSTTYMATLNTGFFNNLSKTVYDTGTGTTNTLSAWSNALYVAIWDSTNSLIGQLSFYMNSVISTLWDSQAWNINTYNPVLTNINIAQWQVLSYQQAAIYGIGNQMATAQWDSINSLIAQSVGWFNNVTSSVWGAASSIVSNGGTDAYNLLVGIYGAASSIVQANLTYSNNTLNSIAVYGGAIISNIQLYGNALINAVYGIGNQIVQADANFTNSLLNQMNGTTNSLINVDTANAQGIGTAVYGTSSQELYTYGVYANNQLYATNNASVTNSNWLSSINSHVYNTAYLVNYYGDIHLQRFDSMITYLYAIQQRLEYPNPVRIFV